MIGIPSNLSNVFLEASSGFRGAVGGVASESNDAKERLRVGSRITLGDIVSKSGCITRNVASGRLGEFANVRYTAPCVHH